MKYQQIDISYTQLKDLIRRKPELLEDGLKYIPHQIYTSGGLLDLLLIDQSRALVIVEPTDVEDDEILIRGIDFYEIANRNLSGFLHAYQDLNIDCGQKPRLVLIAPSFSQSLIQRIKWVKIPISLFSYQCIKFDDAIGEVIPIYKEITSPVVPEKVQEDGLEDQYLPIGEGDKMLAKTILARIQQWDRERIVVKQTDFDISIQISGRTLCYIGPRQTHFIVYTNDAYGRWSRYRVQNKQDMEAVLSMLHANYDKMRR